MKLSTVLPSDSQQQPTAHPLCNLVILDIVLGVAAGVLTIMVVDQLARIDEFMQYLQLIPWSAVVVLLPCFIAGSLILLRWPQLMVYTLAFLLPFNAVGGTYFASTLISLTKVIVNAAFIISVGSVLLVPASWRHWISSTKIGVSLCVLLLWLLFAALLGLAAGYNRYEWLRELNWLSFYAFVLPVGTFIRTRRQMWIVLTALGLGALIYQIIAFNYLVMGARYQRAEDWAGGDTFIRVPFTEAMRFMLIWALASLVELWPRRLLKNNQVFGLLALALIFGVGLLASLGRGLWLTTSVGVGVIVLLTRWSSRTVVGVTSIVVLMTAALPGIIWLDSLSPSSSGRWLENAITFISALSSGQSESSIVGRQIEWANAFELWSNSPLVGNGVGAPFEQVSYNSPGLARFFTHNSYLNILAKMGLVGFVAFVVLVAFTLRGTFRLLRSRDRDPTDRILALSLTAYLVAVLVHSINGATVTTTDTVMFFALIIGLVVTLGRLSDSTKTTSVVAPV